MNRIHISAALPGHNNSNVQAEPDSFAQRFARLHGASICAIAFRVKDAAASKRVIELGAWRFDTRSGPMRLRIPTIKGIGDSLIRFVDCRHGKGQIHGYLDLYQGEGSQRISLEARDVSATDEALKTRGRGGRVKRPGGTRLDALRGAGHARQSPDPLQEPACPSLPRPLPAPRKPARPHPPRRRPHR